MYLTHCAIGLRIDVMHLLLTILHNLRKGVQVLYFFHAIALLRVWRRANELRNIENLLNWREPFGGGDGRGDGLA